MGQGQSQSDKSVSSNSTQNGSTSSHKSKKGKRRSSGKSSSSVVLASESSSGGGKKSRHDQVPSRRQGSGSVVVGSGGGSTSAGRGKRTTGEGASANNNSRHYHHHESHNDHRASFSGAGGPAAAAASGTTTGGGERSVPSRQFSLTRQPSSSSQSTNTSSSAAAAAATSSTHSKHAQIEKYFNKYKDVGEESILAEGMEKFCIDLGVDPTEFIVLVLAWKFEASQMCRFTREEFMNGCQKMQAHNAKSLRERFPDLLAEAKEQKNFKDLYNFTFSFGLDHSSGQRSLPIEMALALWSLVFTQAKPEVLDQWFTFLRETEVKGISRDTWNMFLPFVETTLPDFSNYDESEAWPSLFDDFVEHMLENNTTL